MDDFKFEVSHCYIGVSNFKETDINRLKCAILGKPDVNQLVNFEGYGVVEFESNKHDIWNVIFNDKFTRGKINCLVFSVNKDEKYNPYNYSKLIAFQNLTKNNESYGYVWVKDDGHSLIRFCLDHIDDAIIQHMMQDLNSWKLHHIYAAYSHKPKLNAKEMEAEYKKYIETYRCISYEDWKSSLRVFNQRYKV